MSQSRILIYLLRRDLRLADNPVFNEIAWLNSQSHKPFTHLLPLFVFNPVQQEVSGFISSSSSSADQIQEKSPYPEARSQVGKFWRCGPHRCKFLAESVWDTKDDLQSLKSDLVIRVGHTHEVVHNLVEQITKQSNNTSCEIAALWMTGEVGIEEKREERAVRKALDGHGISLKIWQDEKYFVDDRDLPFSVDNPQRCPDIFSTFRKQVEPLRDVPRRTLPGPSSLPPLPERIPKQSSPFQIPTDLQSLIAALQKPVLAKPDLSNGDEPSPPASSFKTFQLRGGSRPAHDRVKHLIESGSMTTYKDTRNGLLGEDFSTKLSAFLALGSLTARQVHWHLVDFEDGNTDFGKGAQGYGKGENKGTGWVRFELLWRDYMRLVALKFGPRLFRAEGFRNARDLKWSYDKTSLERWLQGNTGMGLVDASQRELYLTGYTSNRTRQNVASFLAKHLGLDWRVGAEWYESLLCDYDMASNWGNWQYNAGVGNDPRGDGGGRKFNPVKQGFDYDKGAEYVRTWCPELRKVSTMDGCFQPWTISSEERDKLDLNGLVEVEKPLIKINFSSKKGKRR